MNTCIYKKLTKFQQSRQLLITKLQCYIVFSNERDWKSKTRSKLVDDRTYIQWMNKSSTTVQSRTFKRNRIRRQNSLFLTSVSRPRATTSSKNDFSISALLWNEREREWKRMGCFPWKDNVSTEKAIGNWTAWNIRCLLWRRQRKIAITH